MKKSLVATFILVGLIVLSSAFTKDDPPLYKNLKVLPKDISKEQLDSVMHHFTGALGVKCTYCHIHNDSTKSWDFASDENKHKLAARGMMKMMDKINDKFFDVTGAKKNLNTQLMVTCYTCHHGNAEPATKPPMPQRQEQRPPVDTTKKAPMDSTRH
jgi:5-methylcytosine-specific restriction endonuclease McrA